MTEITDLLRQHGAPLPRAMAMETEVRSEGIVRIDFLHVPEWAADLRSSSILAEWRCTLQHDDVKALQNLVKTVLPSGVTNEQAINEAFAKLDLGAYLGTFIEEGLLVDGAATVRVLFAYRSATLKRIEDLNRRIYDLLINPGQLREASTALNALRQIWRKGTNKWEGGLLMLSGMKLYDPERFPYTCAKLNPSPGSP